MFVPTGQLFRLDGWVHSWEGSMARLIFPKPEGTWERSFQTSQFPDLPVLKEGTPIEATFLCEGYANYFLLRVRQRTLLRSKLTQNFTRYERDEAAEVSYGGWRRGCV